MTSDLVSLLSDQSGALKRLGVYSLAVFGSVARGDDGPDSDVDLLVQMEPRTFDSYMDAKFLLEAALHRKVDLVLEDGLKPSLRNRVHSEMLRVPGF